TTRGRRQVALPAFAVTALVQHKGDQAERRLRLGTAYRDQGLVFASDLGDPMHPDSITTMFRRLAAKAGMPGLPVHDLRHSPATQLLGQGVNVKVISERLGHADPGFTLRVYSHVLPGMQEEAARKIDGALRGAF